MIKVAIVGTNGLAQYIAHFISTTTSHQFVVVSRRPSPGLTAKGWQVLTVDYGSSSDLRFKLSGVDTVISTISGHSQLALIDAAAAVHVRRFIPSEFGGTPSLRPADDLQDNHRRAAIRRLAHHEASGMRFSVFTCGIFYERFAPGGMAASQIGITSHFGGEGEYIMDLGRMKAHIPYSGSASYSAFVCMTSARDVARFVVAALDLHAWPREFRFRGERLSIDEIVAVGERTRGHRFEISSYTRDSISHALTYARAVRDHGREAQMHQLMATAEGQYDFNNINLNQLVNVRPERFRDWLSRVWAAAE